MLFPLSHLTSLLNRCGDVKRLWIAYSGGVDSHVLLHYLISQHDKLPNIAGAIHIHHGLSANADEWQAHCQMVCARLETACNISRVALSEGEGIEDSARRARYSAIEDYIEPGDVVLLAQHQDDQAETFLLQALRGGGPRGLAAMPTAAPLGAGYLLRPMLETTRAQILDYARQHQLQWVEDESNQDSRFDRNFVRHNVMPVLQQRWPAAGRTLARTAAHTAGLVKIADELLLDELQGIIGKHPDTLSIKALKELSFTRASLLIRAMCQKLALPVPATAHIRELLDKQIHADIDKQIHISWPGAEIRRFQDDLYLLTSLPVLTTQWYYEWDGSGILEIPELNGRLSLKRCQGKGIRHDFIEGGLIIKPRIGGERCQATGDAYQRDLKTIYQYHGIPPWERERLPLIYEGDTLIAVAGIVVCKHAAVAQNEAGYQVLWETFH